MKMQPFHVGLKQMDGKVVGEILPSVRMAGKLNIEPRFRCFENRLWLMSQQYGDIMLRCAFHGRRRRET